MSVEELKEIISRAEELHSKFEKLFVRLYDPSITNNLELLREEVSKVYALSEEKFSVASQMYKKALILGGELENLAREIQKDEHQMKFRIEEVLTILNQGIENFSSKTRIKLYLQRLLQFYRVYDYSLNQSLQRLSAEVEGLVFISEKEKKPPAVIVEHVKKIDELEENFNKLRLLTSHLYIHPSWVYKVEDALREWHTKGLLWVEVRNIEQLTKIPRAKISEILEGLSLIGVVDKRKRGGEIVYKLRGFGEG